MPMTRATIIWFVAAVITGAIAIVLHLLGSEVGGGHDSVGLSIAAWLVTALTAVTLYRGIMSAASEQDDDADRREPVSSPERDPGTTNETADSSPADTAAVLDQADKPALTEAADTRSRGPR